MTIYTCEDCGVRVAPSAADYPPFMLLCEECKIIRAERLDEGDV